MKVEFKALTKEEYIIRRTGKIPAKAKKAIRATVKTICARVAKDEKINLVRQRTGLLAKSLGSVVKTRNDESTVGKAGARSGFRVSLTEAIKGSRKTTLVGDRGGKSIRLKGGLNVARTRGKHKGENLKLDPSKYAHLVELGHKKGRGKGAAKGQKFMAKAAAEANKSSPAELAAAIQKEVRTE